MSPSTCITSVCISRLAFASAPSSRSPSLSELCAGLFCLLWAGCSPGVDLGRGGGIIANLIDFKAVVESMLSTEPEWRLRRAGTMIESIMMLLKKSAWDSFSCWETSPVYTCNRTILVTTVLLVLKEST
jgi:hypothetical protein